MVELAALYYQKQQLLSTDYIQQEMEAEINVSSQSWMSSRSSLVLNIYKLTFTIKRSRAGEVLVILTNSSDQSGVCEK